MSVEEAILRGQQLKEEGNAAFKAGNIGEACVKYEELAVTLEKDDVYDGANEEQKEQIRQLKITCSLNAAMCYLKLEKLAPTIQKATKALELDPNNVKGLYRRGVARLSLGQLDLAKADLEKALYFDPSNADIKRQLKAIKEKTDKQRSSQSTMPSAAGAGKKMSESVLKEIQELEDQYVKVSRELQTLESRIGAAERDKKRAELTKVEVGRLPESTKMYRSIGKMFLFSGPSETRDFLDETMVKCDKQVEDFKARKAYLERQQTSIQSNVKELLAHS